MDEYRHKQESMVANSEGEIYVPFKAQLNYGIFSSLNLLRAG
jgi:hypothetical protein